MQDLRGASASEKIEILAGSIFKTNKIYRTLKNRDEALIMYYLGIDIGSTTSKCVLLDENGKEYSKTLMIAGIGTDGPEQVMSQLLQEAKIKREDIAFIVATGYGRKIFQGADKQMSELSCHAKGVSYVFPAARTIIDIGGQDAKVMSVNESGKLVNFLMNDKCAAGTGRFLDVMANILKLDISDLEKEAFKAEKSVSISSTCTVFAESEVISQLASGNKREDVIAGICDSVAARVASLAKRVGIREEVCMSGGVARNGGVRRALERQLGVTIHYSPDAQFMGAFGAALFAYEMRSAS